MKTQILFIHGGSTFKNRKDYLNHLKKRKISIDKRKWWTNEHLDKNLKNFEIIKPRMPLQDYAQYKEWKIHFEKYFPFLRNNVILIGSSLGGIFLAKYLSENKFPKKILSVYFVGAPFDDTCPKEDLAGGFKLKSDLSMIEKNCKNINLLFSKNDDIVPVAHAKKYKNKLKNANIFIYSHIKGHFITPKFPEIIKMIKSDVKSI
jgi:predicted alpha/beta hydrolase family esterase